MSRIFYKLPASTRTTTMHTVPNIIFFLPSLSGGLTYRFVFNASAPITNPFASDPISQPILLGMNAVFKVSGPFKISNPVVKPHPVFVIYLWFVFRVRNKRSRNQSVNKILFATNSNTPIPEFLFNHSFDYFPPLPIHYAPKV